MSELINKLNIPKHIAITMDGNGRWAKERGKKRVFGHNQGIKSVRDTIEGALEYGVEFLTLFAFSTLLARRVELFIVSPGTRK